MHTLIRFELTSGKVLNIDIEEAKELYGELEKIFGGNTFNAPYVVSYPPVYEPPNMNPFSPYNPTMCSNVVSPLTVGHTGAE